MFDAIIELAGRIHKTIIFKHISSFGKYSGNHLLVGEIG
jgi:hypothetical protein